MEIQPIQILLQTINFGIVAFFLVKFLYHPIAKVLEVRSEKIKLGMDAAEKNLADRSKLETQIKLEQTKARKEAAKIVADAKKQAEAEAVEIITKAKEHAKKVAASETETATTMMAESIKKAEADIRQLVTATTAKVLVDGLTEVDQHRIIDAQIKKLENVSLV